MIIFNLLNSATGDEVKNDQLIGINFYVDLDDQRLIEFTLTVIRSTILFSVKIFTLKWKGLIQYLNQKLV